MNKCYKCNLEIDDEDVVCCNCIDNTQGRNQHFFKIKEEIKKDEPRKAHKM